MEEQKEIVIVRDFAPGDEEAIINIHSACKQWFEEVEITADFLAEISKRPDFRLYVAVCQGSVVGFAGILYYLSVGRAELGPIGIDPPFESKGVGSRLASEAIEFLSEQGIHRLVVRVKEGNERAKEFFRKLGFTGEALLKKYTKKKETVYQMVYFSNTSESDNK
ncbi:MAG: GNAT family N-acetyltransferase [Candidatus Altiarchaeota archaeon]